MMDFLIGAAVVAALASPAFIVLVIADRRAEKSRLERMARQRIYEREREQRRLEEKWLKP